MRLRPILVLAAVIAAAGVLLRRRSGGDAPTPGPPGQTGAPPQPLHVVDRAGGTVSADPDGQWADDGGPPLGAASGGDLHPSDRGSSARER